MLKGATAPTGEMVSVKLTDALCAGLLESVTLKVSGVAVAAPVGVPVIAPVLWLMDRPAGSVPAVRVQMYGELPPVATSEAL